MDSTAIRSHHPLLTRPGTGGHSDLASLLRDGRVLAGRVAEQLANGTLVIAVGNQRIPAEALVPMQVGQSFLFRVEHGVAGIVLRLLGGAAEAEPGLLVALRQLVGQDRPIGELLANLAAALRGRLDGGASGGERATLQETLARLAGHLLQPDGSGDALAALLRRSGLGYEAALLAAAGKELSPEDAARLAQDLKAELLRALGRFPAGPIRDALLRALAGLEAEQLLNLARGESGDPLHLSLALQPEVEGEVPGTLHLFVERRGENEEHGDGEGAREHGHRLALEVELTALGPVRVELWMAEERLAARFLVESEHVAAALTQAFDRLTERLEKGAGSVVLSAAVARPEELRSEGRIADIGYLRDNRLMDLEG